VHILLQNQEATKADLNRFKFQISRKYCLEGIPTNSELLGILTPEEREKLLPILRRKATRALSGVNVIAIMTKPHKCPHGRCAYCPGGPDEETPQSYTGHEPAAMRGSQNEYDAYRQVRSRIEQMEAIGHTVDKIDLIIMGGTFPATSRSYQEFFVQSSLDALRDSRSSSLFDAKLLAESNGIKNVGITVETRPDYLSHKEISYMLDLGVTRVEIGVQNIFEDIYQKVNRGHTLEDVITGTQNLKDSALKVCYHMMPGLPGSSFERDFEGFKTLFSSPRFKPDMLKIYPTLVVENTRLHEWWKNGDYEPLSTERAVELISKVKQIVPPWVRIMRVQRDIPLHQIKAGVDKSNLRQLIHNRLREVGGKCGCIRCREVGLRARDGIHPDEIKLIHCEYVASGGIESFISAEDVENDVLVGFVRLRVPSCRQFRPQITLDTGLIRELHVYGKMLPVGEVSDESWQHQGWGHTLMAEAEKIAREKYDLNHIVIMSALGTKKYFARMGYLKSGVYVSKTLL
jgi:elongator complex protein 3